MFFIHFLKKRIRDRIQKKNKKIQADHTKGNTGNGNRPYLTKDIMPDPVPVHAKNRVDPASDDNKYEQRS